MRSAALEYAKYGITVNAVQPGNVLTDGLKAQGEAYLEGTRKIIPTHELGEPLDIGYAVTFFCVTRSKIYYWPKPSYRWWSIVTRRT